MTQRPLARPTVNPRLIASVRRLHDASTSTATPCHWIAWTPSRRCSTAAGWAVGPPTPHSPPASQPSTRFAFSPSVHRARQTKKVARNSAVRHLFCRKQAINSHTKAINRGPDWPSGRPGGSCPKVLLPHGGQTSRCRWYSVTIGSVAAVKRFRGQLPHRMAPGQVGLVRNGRNQYPLEELGLGGWVF